jgi:hypothetical protein
MECAKVHPDYHIEVEHAYSPVPYRYIGRRVDVRISAHDRDLLQAPAHGAARPLMYLKVAMTGEHNAWFVVPL